MSTPHAKDAAHQWLAYLARQADAASAVTKYVVAKEVTADGRSVVTYMAPCDDIRSAMRRCLVYESAAKTRDEPSRWWVVAQTGETRRDLTRAERTALSAAQDELSRAGDGYFDHKLVMMQNARQFPPAGSDQLPCPDCGAPAGQACRCAP